MLERLGAGGGVFSRDRRVPLSCEAAAPLDDTSASATAAAAAAVLEDPEVDDSCC